MLNISMTQARELAVTEAVRRAQAFGISVVGVVNSHRAGVLVDHVRVAAEAGLVGLGFANAPSAMPAAGAIRSSAPTRWLRFSRAATACR